MYSPMRRPDEILAYRSLQEMLAAKPKELWTVGPNDNVLTALRLMADKRIGFVVVVERDAMVGVLSERDCVRHAARAERKLFAETPVSEIMTRNVITVDLTNTFVDCRRLMHQHGIRHLPVVAGGKPIAVISVRDLLSEAVTHHEKIIAALERERMTLLNSPV
jgi:CBS domain-containing protein